MAVYIDKKAADNALTAAAAADSDKKRRTWAKAIGVLHDVPAADVVPVVRCKECKHYTFLGHCLVHSQEPDRYGPGYMVEMLLDDFCSYGERRESQHGQETNP